MGTSNARTLDDADAAFFAAAQVSVAVDLAGVADATVGPGVTMRAVRAASALRDAAISGVVSDAALGVTSGVAPASPRGAGVAVDAHASLGAPSASNVNARSGVTRREAIMGAGLLALAGLASAVSARAMGAEAARSDGEGDRGDTSPDVPGGAGAMGGMGGA